MVYLVTDVRYCVLNQRARARSSKIQGLVNRFGPGLPNALALESGADWDRAFENECRTHAKRLADAGPITIVSIGGDSFPIQWPVDTVPRVPLSQSPLGPPLFPTHWWMFSNGPCVDKFACPA